MRIKESAAAGLSCRWIEDPLRDCVLPTTQGSRDHAPPRGHGPPRNRTDMDWSAGTHDHRPAPRVKPPRPPLLETAWQATSPSGKVLTCALYRGIDGRVEARAEYPNNDLIRSALVRDVVMAPGRGGLERRCDGQRVRQAQSVGRTLAWRVLMLFVIVVAIVALGLLVASTAYTTQSCRDLAIGSDPKSVARSPSHRSHAPMRRPPHAKATVGRVAGHNGCIHCG